MSSETEHIDSLLAKANDARRENQFKEAKKHIVSALKASRKLADPGYIAKSLNRLARIERDLNNIASSIRNYKELAVMCENNSNMQGVAHALRHLGDIFREEGQPEEAEAHYRKALQIYKTHNTNRDLNIANTLRGFALLKSETGNPEEARPLWEDAKLIYLNFDISSGVEECDYWLEKLS